ncbi:hypothetical protein ACHWQZ_G005984 [Mnemiopsis leidyi]
MVTADTKQTYLEKIAARNSSAPKDCSLSYAEMEKLAESLSDGTVFGIISELKEIQEIKLSNLSNERNTVVKSFQEKKEELETSQGQDYEEMMADENFRPSDEERLLKKFKSESTVLEAQEKEALQQFDLGVLEQLDKQVEDQQKYLDIAGIPGMRETTDRLTIKKQMFMLSVIESLPQPE